MIITDTGIWPGRLNKEDVLIQEDGKIRPCNGCFSCWTKTPGMCVIPDRLQKVPALLMQCDTVVIVSRCTFGSVSPFVKNVLDRMMPCMSADITKDGGGYVHKPRYKHTFDVECYFYGTDISRQEKDLATKLLETTMRQLNGEVKKVSFYLDAVSIGELK